MIKQTVWGIFSPEGDFQAISNVAIARIEYASVSVTELEEVLLEKLMLEDYEQCALIRDELQRRKVKAA